MKRIIVLTLLMLLLFPATALASSMMVLIDVTSPFAPAGAWKAVIVGSGSSLNETRFTVDPVIENGRTLVPLRQVANALGYEVRWDAPNKKITLIGHNLQEEDVTLVMKIGQNEAIINGRTVTMDVPPKIIQNSTMIPIRFVSEAMGYFVKYRDEVIYITNYELLNDTDFPSESDPNWVKVTSTKIQLKKDGKTSRGIKLGDSIETVIQAYPRGNKYSGNFSDVLYYDSTIPYNTESKGIVFAFDKGVVTAIYTANEKPSNAK
ncbi:MAG: copper amine oxidase N-terminal domain-containing protein [Tissierellia bacterium]|nr:copper amine oxidase N-terminal domain-containing protein [Tissierellia bacterium]